MMAIKEFGTGLLDLKVERHSSPSVVDVQSIAIGMPENQTMLVVVKTG